MTESQVHAASAMSTSRSAAPAGVVGDCDIASRIDAIPGVGNAVLLMLVVRIFTEPIGVLETTLPPSGLSSRELANQIAATFRRPLRERLDDAGLPWLDELPTTGLAPSRTPRFLATRTAVLAAAPEMTVVVCTKDRPDDLSNALNALFRQEHRPKRILVVDNASNSRDTQRLVSTLSKGHDHLDYVSEPRPGLSWARNRAISETDTEVIAWFDDDAVCDQWWTAEIVRGFVEEPAAEVTTGPLVPMELLTESQVLFERYSGLLEVEASTARCYRVQPRLRARFIRCRLTASARTWRFVAAPSSESGPSIPLSAPGH